MENKAYLHTTPVLTIDDLADARYGQTQAGDPTRFLIEIVLTKEGAKKIAESSRVNLDKSLVFLIDGKITAAIVPKNPIVSESIPIVGTWSDADAERIFKAVRGK
jgi:preprotein translocase subunit SecD